MELRFSRMALQVRDTIEQLRNQGNMCHFVSESGLGAEDIDTRAIV